MALDYAELATVAKTLVEEAGRSVTLEKFNATPADANKPWNGPTNPRSPVAATVTAAAVFVDPSNARKLGLSRNDDSLFKRAEQIMIVAPGPSEANDLSTFNEVVDGSIRWRIVASEVLKPADVVMCYFIGVAR